MRRTGGFLDTRAEHGGKHETLSALRPRAQVAGVKMAAPRPPPHAAPRILRAPPAPGDLTGGFERRSRARMWRHLNAPDRGQDRVREIQPHSYSSDRRKATNSRVR